MNTRLPLSRFALAAALVLASVAVSARAEKADRAKPFVFESQKGGTVDVVTQRTEFVGNVVLTKGSLLLRAERVDVRETPDGYHQAFASGIAGKPVTFRQARDVPGEAIEGVADQLEYDTRSDTVRFLGNAVVRRMRGAQVADEVTGAIILYDNRTEVFTLEGGTSSPHPNGRARVVMMPRVPAAEGGASAPEALPLQPTPALPARKQPS